MLAVQGRFMYACLIPSVAHAWYKSGAHLQLCMHSSMKCSCPLSCHPGFALMSTGTPKMQEHQSDQVCVPRGQCEHQTTLSTSYFPDQMERMPQGDAG